MLLRGVPGRAGRSPTLARELHRRPAPQTGGSSISVQDHPVAGGDHGHRVRLGDLTASRRTSRRPGGADLLDQHRGRALLQQDQRRQRDADGHGPVAGPARRVGLRGATPVETTRARPTARRPGRARTFSGAGDPAVSYVSGGSLQANFAAALHGRQARLRQHDDLHGGRRARRTRERRRRLSTRSMRQRAEARAGWNPGETVTVDGATFTAARTSGPPPAARTTCWRRDQTIGTGTDGAQGSARWCSWPPPPTPNVAGAPVSSGRGPRTAMPCSQGDATAPATPGGVTGDRGGL